MDERSTGIQSLRSPLSMSAHDMRRSGYALIDALVELVEQPDPAIRRATREHMRSDLGWGVPDEPWGVDETMRVLLDDVVPWASKPAHPGYFAYIPSSTTWPSALADLVASVTNTYTGTWMESAGASHLELVLIDTFRSWLGMPEGTSGVLVSGGSAANLTGLAVARELRVGAQSDTAVVYCSDQTHSSVGRSARLLGFGPTQVRVVPSDRDFRMRPEALRTVLEADVAAGRMPLAVVASAGSTNTGSVDPLDEIATICAEHGVWLHVDAAYGGFAALTEPTPSRSTRTSGSSNRWSAPRCSSGSRERWSARSRSCRTTWPRRTVIPTTSTSAIAVSSSRATLGRSRCGPALRRSGSTPSDARSIATSTSWRSPTPRYQRAFQRRRERGVGCRTRYGKY